MIVGAAVLPTAPVLVAGVSATMPPGIPKVRDAIDAALEALPASDIVVLVTAGEGALHTTQAVSLRDVGRADVTVTPQIHAEALSRLSDATEYVVQCDEGLPLGLSVLALYLGGGVPVAPLTVPATASFDELSDLGSGVAATLAGNDIRASVVVAGDLSAGLTEKSPMHYVSGAIFWDEQAVAAVDSSRLGALRRLGPQEATRVGALGWAPLVVLHGATAAAKIGMVVRHYSAPRGVGYLVANGG